MANNTMVSNQAQGLLQTCPSCAREFRAPQILVGRAIPCPNCRRMITVTAPAARTEDRLVGREVGGCILEKRLGAGALGVVYAAEQRSVGRKIALKMLSTKAAADPETVARFYREAKLCAQTHHPHVVEVYDCNLDPKTKVHYLVMELVEGATFASLIEEHGKLPWSDALAYGLQIANALSELHRQGVIHRDIKPANILINYDGIAKLADLGLAKQMDSGIGLTMQGVAMGSPAYMPPEQIRDAKSATPKSDLYALGASLYQAISGQLPFDGKNATEVMGRVLKEPPAPLGALVPGLPLGVVALVERLLAKDPLRRHKDAAALIADIEAVFKAPDQAAPAPAPARSTPASGSRPPASGWPTRQRDLIIAGVVVVVALGLVLAAVLR
jgi:serine/threonine protein kinase